MLRRVDLERTNVSEDISAFIIRVTSIGELGMLGETSKRRTLQRSVGYYKSHKHIPEDDICYILTDLH
jgi:hypothetical protein